MSSGEIQSADAAASVSTVKTIVLQLDLNPGARSAPTGRSQGYVITAPLTETGYLEILGPGSRRWPVRRFGDAGDGDTGWLARRGETWIIDYDPDSESDDEPIFSLADHRFVIGEYVTITNEHGTALTYRVASVDPAD